MRERHRTSMTCEEAQDLLLGMLSGQRERLIEHLTQCHECLTSMAAMEMMAFGELSPEATEMIRLSRFGAPRPPVADYRAPVVEAGRLARRDAVRTAGEDREDRAMWKRPLAAMAAVVIVACLASLGFTAYATIDTANHRRDRAAALANLMFNEAQKNDHLTFHNKVESFDLGDDAAVRPGEEIPVVGIVRYPRSCEYYWLLFSENRVDGVAVIWPQLAVRNSGLLSQKIALNLRVPRDMERGGEIVLACVDNETHQQFDEWRRQGNVGPLLARDLEVVLRTVLTIEENP